MTNQNNNNQNKRFLNSMQQKHENITKRDHQRDPKSRKIKENTPSECMRKIHADPAVQQRGWEPPAGR